MSDVRASSSAPADDFIQVTLESTISDSLHSSFSSNKSQYSQVVFFDLSEVYPTDGDISFSYSFQPGVIPQVGDCIALYKVGWSSVSEYVTKMFANPPEEGLPLSKSVFKITFPVENLPKDENNMYQFSYITTGNIVAGSSMPFTFRKPHASELVAVEDPTDSGLVVFRSRVTQLQEQLVKSNSEKENLEKTIEKFKNEHENFEKNIQELKSELYLAKAEVNEKVQKCDIIKDNIQDLTSVIYGLNTEKKQLMEKLAKGAHIEKQIEELEKCKKSFELEIIKLNSQIESLKMDIIDKGAIIVSLNKKLEISSLEGKQVKELQKGKESLENDISRLQGLIDSQKNDIAIKDATIMDLSKGKKICEEQIKELKEQLLMAEENFDELSEAMKLQEQDTQNQLDSLGKKLKEMTERNNASCAESLSLTKDLEKANNQVKSLEEIVKSKDNTLKNFLESSNDSSDMPRRLFSLEDDNALLQVQVFSLEEKVQSCESETSRLTEENNSLKKEKISMAEQLSKMNEDLRNLKRGSQPHGRFNRHYSKFSSGQPRAKSEHEGPFAQFSHFIPFFTPFQGGVSTSVNVGSPSEEPPAPSTSTMPEYENCEDLENKVKALMMEKADIRSNLIQTKHANEEYCRHLREVNEEAAALRSRIAVLEIELRKAKETSITSQGEQKFKHMYDALSNSWKADVSMESSSGLKPDDSAEKRELKESLMKELETKALLQRNNEALMILEAKNFATIDTLKRENAKLTSELAKLSEGGVMVEELRQALDKVDRTKEELSKNLISMTLEKSKLETQLIELRKESVGKVSLTTVQQLRDENDHLKKQIGNQECCKKLRDKLEAAGEAVGLSLGRITQQQQLSLSQDGWSIPPSVSGENTSSGGAFICPVCMINFPPDSANAYNKHFSDHLD